MSIIRLPSEHDTSYPPARGPALVLSCMDLRLVDEIVQFMDHDNLSNRYDHVILAGAALGALGGGKDPAGGGPKYPHWKETFWDHLEKAHVLHHIKDVYILEHRNCGAYEDFLQEEGVFGDSKVELKREAKLHRKHAFRLRRKIKRWATDQGISLRVKCFLMDLRGKVSLLR
jgi:hypothetical protein